MNLQDIQLGVKNYAARYLLPFLRTETHAPGVKKKITIQILYDGNCPICLRKIRFLRRRDRSQKLDFIDIRSSNFRASTFGISPEEAAAKIHAILPDGIVIRGMEVIRAAYREIGLGWLAAPTGWPGLRPLFDALYGGVAQHRHAISRFFR